MESDMTRRDRIVTSLEERLDTPGEFWFDLVLMTVGNQTRQGRRLNHRVSFAGG